MNTLRGIAMMLRRDEAGLDRRSIEVVPSQKSLLRRCIFGIVVVAMLVMLPKTAHAQASVYVDYGATMINTDQQTISRTLYGPIGGMIFNFLGTLPKPGAQLKLHGLTLTVRRVSRKRIEEVLIVQDPALTAPEDEEEAP